MGDKPHPSQFKKTRQSSEPTVWLVYVVRLIAFALSRLALGQMALMQLALMQLALGQLALRWLALGQWALRWLALRRLALGHRHLKGWCSEIEH